MQKKIETQMKERNKQTEIEDNVKMKRKKNMYAEKNGDTDERNIGKQVTYQRIKQKEQYAIHN